MLAGALSGANFAPNATGTAGGNNGYFIYESDDGFLSFDADGSDGAFTAVKLATLSGAPVITETDIVLARKQQYKTPRGASHGVFYIDIAGKSF